MTDNTETLARSASTESSTKNPHGDFIWYELITPDPVAAKTFYDAVVGWNIEAQPSGEMDYRMIGAADGQAGGVMRLTDEMQSHGARPAWLGYVGVDDVDRSVAEIEQAGGKTLMPAFDIPNVGRIAFVTDPQGAPFYVMRGATDEASTAFSTDRAQHIRWNELSTTDPEAAIAFYTERFGWRQEGDLDMGEMGKYRFLYQDETMIGAVMPKMPQMPVSLWSYYIGVDDIDRAAAAVKDGGGQILMGPMEIPGGEFSLNALDPQGASFGLVGPRQA